MSDLLFEDDEPEASGPNGDNAPPATVSELSARIKRSLEDGFGRVRVRGEIGRVSRPRSGHVYLDLKDDRAVISGVVWRGAAQRLEVSPEEGLEVVAEGKITTFPGQSKYQIVIEQMAPAGVGALMAMLEARKKKLAEEGLFGEARKREVPFLPDVIGVVSSPSGAVIRDILHRLSDRFPRPVLLWPVAVQGEKCAPEVVAAIQGFNALAPGGQIPRPDVLIVARGGGSVEDLWGFNEEIVARAVAASEIPVISAVGHETDTTLIDFVSDRRAPTPTAAAEMAAPVRGELLATLSGLEERRERALSRLLEERRTRLRDLARALPRPDELAAMARQRLDAVGERLPRALMASANMHQTRLARVAARLSSASLVGRIEAGRERAALFGDRLRPALERAVGQTRDRWEKSARLLEVFSYKATLSRGYAAVRGASGVASSAAELAPGETLEIEFSDGRVTAKVNGAASSEAGAGKLDTMSNKRAEASKRRKKKSEPSQGDLF
ncbi:MAG: exodeoxyribonuclease VII large subunit [Rhodobacteraceae bacterium]|nr:exodeoxyribonuclease VII large subunit [Paracoccaceae bacterium]